MACNDVPARIDCDGVKMHAPQPPLSRRRRLVMTVWCLLLVVCLPRAAPAAETHEKPLILGILPFESAIALFRRFSPLREYLSQKLQHPVILETARDFPEFIQRTRTRQYDMIITAPHFTLLALDSGHYEVVGTYVTPLAANIVVRNGSPIHNPAQLAGKRIATPPKGAIITLIGKHYLETLGLTGAKAPTYIAFRTHNASDQAVLGGQADAAIVSINVFHLARQQGTALHRIARSPDIPGMGLLVATDMPHALKAAFESTMFNMHNTPEGRRVLKVMAYPGYKPATRKDFEAARPYLKAYLKLQQQPVTAH